MDNVSIRKDGKKLFVELKGHIDSANAGDIEKVINTGMSELSPVSVELDCTDLSYISSAGLRIILRIKKAIDDTSLVNVSSDVYEVLDMTGFTEMMDVKKAYRVLSVEGAEIIGQGANGKVYRIDADTIVKVYLNPDALPEIHRERELARTAFVSGIPTAIPYDVVKIEGGGYGSVFELLNAKSFAKLLITGEKTVDEVARMSIDLLKQIHGTVVKEGSMPDMKETALDWASFLKDYLPNDKAEKLVSLVSAVPKDLHLLHGDYHIKNVMLQNGEALLIDMDTLCYGHPVFELASMFNAYAGFHSIGEPSAASFLGIPTETADLLWNKLIRLYLEGRSAEEIEAVEKKAQLIGYTRLMRRTIRRHGFDSETGRASIEICKEKILALLDEVDTLLF